ncbi:hypothetical protein TWF506_011019 [Arthrobotrys conoides]|uniref:Uncharacterized protein n=1 Tax=Arthrobotrys conoides TaxID=74498 RepID=A0AAN8NJ18_9PEZI
MAYLDAKPPAVLPSRKEDKMTQDQMILVLHQRAGRSAVKKLLSHKTGQGGQGRKGPRRPTRSGSPPGVPSSDVVAVAASVENAPAQRGLTGMFGLTLEQVIAHRARAATMLEFVNSFVGLTVVEVAEATATATITTTAITTTTAAATTTTTTTTTAAAAVSAAAAPPAAKPVNQYGRPVACHRRRRVDDLSSALKSGDGHATGIRAFHRPDSPLRVTFQRYQSPLKLPCPKKAKDSVNQANISFVLNTEAKAYHQAFVTVECRGVMGEEGIWRAPKRKCKTHFPWLWEF